LPVGSVLAGSAFGEFELVEEFTQDRIALTEMGQYERRLNIIPFIEIAERLNDFEDWEEPVTWVFYTIR
jgi:hypothetical protein